MRKFQREDVASISLSRNGGFKRQIDFDEYQSLASFLDNDPIRPGPVAHGGGWLYTLDIRMNDGSAIIARIGGADNYWYYFIRGDESGDRVVKPGFHLVADEMLFGE